ncbi:hypothetical protein [Helicobacter pylori]|uniref:hypothetical protein n=1 Tax=Helicobacter pylori TaxID=210 RepID=UPI001FD45C3F|nr:hypothetical protein [Helicobacter pylori]UOR83735.1 hypothetical protein MPG14_02235 [Helicobacter pylori]
MKQRVHSVSYLAKAEFEIKNGVYDLVALPTGAEVLKVSLEVLGGPGQGTVNVGFKDEPQKNYFLNLASLMSGIKEPSSFVNTFTSNKDYTATSNKVVVASVEQNDLRDVDANKAVLRVVYFLPSVIEVEY